MYLCACKNLKKRGGEYFKNKINITISYIIIMDTNVHQTSGGVYFFLYYCDGILIKKKIKSLSI